MRCLNNLSQKNLHLLLVITLYLFSTQSSSATANALISAQQQAQQQNLAEQPQWQALLHYQQHKSLVTDRVFFLHPNGAEDKHAELDATLAAFFQTTIDDDNSAQCRFPARFAWLQQQVTVTLPQHRCEKLHVWLKNLAVTGITLVFPVAYLNNPASMFGHSFLRLDSQVDKKSRSDLPGFKNLEGLGNQNSDLMAETVNYAADTEHEHGITFALKGLFGGYQGQYSLNSYYVLLKEYADLESRDVWEYTLNFSPAEQQRLLLHLWEIQNTHFDYYFINKNCSFQLLALLEVARPDLHLTQQFHWDAIPADTVRAVVSVPHLLKQVHYRPALATQITATAKLLAESEQTLAKSLAQNQLKLDDASFNALPVGKQAQTLELAFAYLSYLNADKIKQHQPLDGKLAHSLLTARSSLPKLVQKVSIPTPEFRPDQAHAGNRLQLAAGYDGIAPYTQLALRWSYHDVYDPAEGFAQGSQVEFFKPSLRYYPEQQRVQFEGLELININSMPAGNSFIKPFSWQVSLAANRQRFPAQQHSLVGAAKAGVGFSYHANEQCLLSVSALASLLIGNQLQHYTALGLGGSVFGYYDVSTRWRVGAEAAVLHYLQGVTHTNHHYSVTQRFTLSNTQAVVLNLGRSNEFDQPAFTAQLAWQFYF
jgi:Domain of unknown function (DUF4105)